MKHRTFIVLGCLVAGGAQATLSYNEFYNGDLSYLYPGDTTTVLNLGVGENTVNGRLSSWGDFDTFAFNVPQATQLNGVSLSFGISTATGYFPSNQSATYGLSSGIGLPYAPYPNGNYAQTVNFSTTNPTSLFPLATPLGAGTYTIGDFTHNDFSSGYVDYSYTLNVQSLAPPPLPESFNRTIDPCIVTAWCADQYRETFDGSALTLSMTIGLNGSASNALKTTWTEGIEKYWGNLSYGSRFSIQDGLNKYPIYFNVDFVDSGSPSDFTVNVVDDIGRTETSTWYTTIAGWGNDFQDEAAAHEFGHFLGLYDEYKGGTLAPPLGLFGLGWLCDESKPLSDPVNANCDGLMGDLRKPTVDRYYENIVDDFANFTRRDVVLASSPFPPPTQSVSDYLDTVGEGTLGPSNRVPEPSTLWLLIWAAGIYVSRHKRSLRGINYLHQLAHKLFTSFRAHPCT